MAAYSEDVVVVLGFAVIALMVLLAVGALTGRVQSRACCSVADPRLDLRMRAAFLDTNDGRP